MYDLLVSFACYANDNDAFIPERWAMEGLAILEENMVMAKLVNRDFSPDVAEYGDVVNTRRPSNFRNVRKTDADSITLQDAQSTNVAVSLNMHNTVAFTIKDGEASKSFKDLVQTYLQPGAIGIANGIDRMLAGQAQRFQTNAAGILDGVTSSTAADYLLEARQQLNVNKAPLGNRNLILGPSAETLLLKTDMFVKANERGDGGAALENARLGKIFGFDTYMDQNSGGLPAYTSVDYVAGAISNVGGYAAASTAAMTVVVTAYEVEPGEFVVCDTDGQLTYATASTASTDTTSITLHQGLKYAVANDCNLVVYKNCDVCGAYAVGHVKEIVVDGYNTDLPPQVGQLIAFGATVLARHTYTIIEAYESSTNSSQTCITLDRALSTALSDNDLAFPGPVGGVQLAFHKDAIALISRPLALPRSSNVQAGVLNYNDIAMRVAMQYDIDTQGTKVVLDLLCGVQVLDTNLGCVYLT